MAVDIRKAIQELIIPEIREIRVEIKGLSVEIKRLDDKIDSLRHKMLAEIRRLDEKIDSGIARLDQKIDISLDLRDRISALEAKVANLSH